MVLARPISSPLTVAKFGDKEESAAMKRDYQDWSIQQFVERRRKRRQLAWRLFESDVPF